MSAKRRLRLFYVSTWFLGFQTVRTYIAPWEYETQVFLIPGVGIGVKWRWIGIPGRSYDY